MKSRYLASSIALLPVVFGAAAFAQGIITGSLSGTVVDPSGAVVPDATVTATDKARGTSFTAHAAADGNFAFQALPVGSYDVIIHVTGFSDTRIPNTAVDAGATHGLGKTVVSIGNASTTVEVESNSAQLETTQSQVSVSFDSEMLASLPLNNGFDSVALLEPGVAPTHDLNFSNTNGANFSSNGARGRSNNFELDGQSNNDNSIAGPQVFFGNQDAIAEIQVVQTNFSAQYGRNEGTVVNYITKSGTNQLHGSAFELYEGNFMASFPNQDKSAAFGYCAPGQTPAADGCSAVSRLPRSVDNRYGGTLGGAILKDKLFGFGSTYWQHTRVGASPFNSGTSGLTPTPTGLQTLAAAFPNNPGVAVLTNYGPYGVTLGNPQPVLNQASTETVTTPSGAKVAVQVAPVTRTVQSGTYADQEHMGRIDWQATQKDRVFLRYFYQKSLGNNYSDGGAGGTFYDVPDVAHSVGADYTRSFSNNFVNQLRYSFQQSKLDFQSGSFPNCTVNTLTACPGKMNFTDNSLGFGEATNLPQGRTVKTTQVQDNISFNHGRNTFLFGGEYDRQNSPNIFLPLYNGEAQFSGLQGLLDQTGNFYLATGDPVLPFTENDFSFYGQDNIKVSQSLTFNIGLRWEFFGQAINLLHDQTVARESNPATAIWDQTLPVSARSSSYVNPFYKNFEPRVGFAYNPQAFPKTVFRGGFSIGVDPAIYNIFLNAAEVAPVSTAAGFACGGTCLGTGDFSGAGLRGTNLSKLPLGGNPAFSDQEYVPSNFRNPYLETYSLGMQQQVGTQLVAEIRYVGTHGVGNFQSVDANPYLADLQSAFPHFPIPSLCTDTTAAGVGRPNCGLGNQELITNGGFSIYNSLQTQLTMRSYHGFTGTVNYTFSHAVDNSSEIFSTGAGGSTISVPQNPLDQNLGERGTSGFSLPNVFASGLSYVVPDLRFGPSLLRHALNGFRLNSIYQYNSGQAYNPYQSLFTGSFCDAAFNGSTVGPQSDSCRLILANKNAPLQSIGVLNKGVYQDFATGTTIAPGSAHWTINNTEVALATGNPFPGSGRNILRAQPFNNLDASIFKDFQIFERLKVQIQMNAYNTLNHQFRGTPLPYAGYDSGTSGSLNPFLSNAYNTSGQRLFQFAGKVMF